MRAWIGLVLVMVLHIGLKNRAYWTAVGFEPARTTFFWTESAMHEYLAGRAAGGASLTGLDRRAQHPEGVDLRADFTLGMPYTWGTLYRVIGPPCPLDVFIAYAQILISSLTVLGVFGLARAVFASDRAALVSALAYAVSTASVARSVGGFLHEDFAHPLIVGALALFLTGLARRRTWFAVAASALVIASLLSWHFTQFVLLAFALSLVLAEVTGLALPRAYVGIFAGLIGAGALLTPSLRAQGAWGSPAIATLIGLAIYLAGVPRLGRRAALAPAIMVWVGTSVAYVALGFGQQSHVFGLALEKLRHGLVKPPDPKLLSFETRSVWIEDDNSPGWSSLILFTSLYIPAAAIGASSLGRSGRGVAGMVAAVMAASGLLLFVIARRMVTTEIIWLSVLVAGVTCVRGLKVRRAVLLLGLIPLGLELSKTWSFNRGGTLQTFIESHLPAESEPPLSTFGDQTDLMAWIRTQTGADDAILAPIGLSPVILAQTGRPIVLHSKWESRVLRGKFECFLTALFGSEATFAEFAHRSDATYFVHDANTVVREGPDSARYMADQLRLDQTSAAYLFNYHPERLAHFDLVYQNSSYRVFRVGRAPSAPPAAPPPLFDADLARADALTTIGARLMVERAQFKAAIGLSQVDPARAEALLLKLRRDGDRARGLDAYLCYTRLALNDLARAESYCRAELAARPHSVIGRFHSGLLAEVRGDAAAAQTWYAATLAADPRFAPALERVTK